MKGLKNQNLSVRFGFAVNGIKQAWISERSFRTQVMLTLLALPVIVYLKATPLWWAIFALIVGATLAMELVNTSLEFLMDTVHPEYHKAIGIAKDCAAGAVLVLSTSSVIIFLLFLYTKANELQ